MYVFCDPLRKATAGPDAHLLIEIFGFFFCLKKDFSALKLELER